jgi:tetratricopeptide (TPR) repeat protein
MPTAMGSGARRSHGLSDAQIHEGRAGGPPERLQERRRRLCWREGRSLLSALIWPTHHNSRIRSGARRLLPEELWRGKLTQQCAPAGSCPASRAAFRKEAWPLRPKGEKELFKAIKAQDVKAIRQVGIYHRDFRLPSYSLAGLMMLTSEPTEAEQLLSEAFATGKDPAEDEFVSSYLFTRLELSIAQGVTAELPVNRDAVGLALAELKQEDGDIEGAIDIIEQLEPTTHSAVSLAELYAQTERWDDVIELTEGMKNEDDASALLCVFRGQAFRQQGFHDAAHEALKEALRSRSREAPIRHMALAERAQNYLAQGKKGMARKDLERILAEDSDYPNVREELAKLSA